MLIQRTRITYDDAEDLDDQQFIVHTTQPMPPEERTAAKEVKLSSEDQALHDELVSLMHQESLAKAHNDDQRIAFEEEKRRISIAKGKEHVDSTFTLSTANTPPQSIGNTPTDSDDDTPTDGVFSTNSFDAEEGGVADYNNLDPTIDVPSTPTLRIHKIHPQSQIIGKSTAGVQTRRKLQDRTREITGYSYQEQARLVAQGYRQEEGVDYDEVFAPVARIEAIRLFLAFASFMGFTVYQMDVKSAFLYGNITEEHGYRRGAIDKTLFIKKDRRDIMLVQVYVDDIIFGSTKSSMVKDFEDLWQGIQMSSIGEKMKKVEDVDISSHSTGFSSTMHVKRDLCDLRDNHDRRSTSGGCQYLGRRLVSWQCKKQTIVAISSTEAEYVAAASCCAQVLWMQNQLLDYGFNFMNTEIHIDNESTICIVKNPVFHSKTKHIQIRHHFIRDCYEQRLINVVKVHTDDNVADLLTKGFDLARFNFLVPEEEQSTSPHSRAASSARDAQGIPTQSAAHSQSAAPSKLMLQYNSYCSPS
ncbi:putative ribonuclease H-like domain-containing protein [Tanacetum coccineum]